MPVADEALAGCEDLLADGKVQVCTSDDVDRPSVIGFFAPRILVPAWLFGQMSAVELRHVVLHEMAHLRRRDDWTNLLQKVGLVMFALNPALFWVDRQLAAEREIACDDGVLRRIQTPRAYAASLASIAEMRLERKMHRRVVALALGVLGRSEFSKRIERILGRRARVSSRVSGALAGVLVVGVLGAGVELARAPQLVSFSEVSGGGNLTAAVTGVSGSGRIAAVDLVAFRDEGDKDNSGFPSGMTKNRGKSRVASEMTNQRVATTQQKKSEGEVVSVSDKDDSRRAVPANLVLDRELERQNNSRFPSGMTKGKKDDGSSWIKGQSKRRFPSGMTNKGVETPRWMVLTAFYEDEPARVVVRFEDGRVYEVPYAAVPVRDGWLIVQL